MAPPILTTPQRTYHFGLKPRTIAYGAVCPRYSDRIPVDPPEKWRNFSLSHFVRVVLDQGEQLSCTGAASAAAMMVARSQCGLVHVEISIGSIYGQINDGIDGGAVLHRALHALVTTGACPASVIPHSLWDMRQWPPDWRDIARRYRIIEWYDCSSFDEIVSAILRGFVVPYGIFLPRSFIENPNAKIDASEPARYAHAMLGIGVKYTDDWYIETLNSWGLSWGDGGRCFVPRWLFDRCPMLDAWAVRVVRCNGRS